MTDLVMMKVEKVMLALKVMQWWNTGLVDKMEEDDELMDMSSVC